jgi:methylated-DNA-protein-cysteine methyltransferase-like protein
LAKAKPDKNFFQMVYEIACQVPRGRVTTYSAIAKYLGVPRGARAVGWAMRVCRNPNVPCHRVVRSDGSISGDLDGSRATDLRSEGIAVKSFRLDLSKFYFDDFRPNPRKR